LVLAAYALGSVSTGYYLVRLRTGQDIRRLGSGSAGSRNVARTLGLGASAATLASDAAKGAIAVGAALLLGLDDWAVLLVIAAIVAGQVWPVQLGFKGGKGLATVMGAVLVMDFRLVLVAYLVVAITLGLTRRVTVGGLVAVGLTPVVAVLMGHSHTGVIGLSLLAALIFFTHRENVQSVVREAHWPPGKGA
jgi:glycerol-3-phosphate acyltransferase PlsY